MKSQRLAFIYLPLITLLYLITPQTFAAIIVTSGFESGDFESEGWYVSGNSPQVVSSGPICTGKYSLKTDLDYFNSNNSFRTELTLGRDSGLDTFKIGNEYWIGVAIYLPENYVADKWDDILMQVHGVPDLDLGEPYRQPPMALYTDEGMWKVWIKYASDQVSDVQGTRVFDLGTHETNKWTKFVFHIIFSYKNDGLTEVWRDGEKLVTYSGPNAFNDKVGPYLKMGDYKASWKPNITWGGIDVATSRTIYHDDFKIGDNNSSYNEVVPQCGSTVAQPSSTPPEPVTITTPSPPTGLSLSIE